MAKAPKSSVAETTDNTVIWNALRATPEAYLKTFKKAGGFSGKSIDPVYRIMRLTEQFGPCGKGWGFVQEDQFSDAGSGAYCVYVRGHLWYMLDGERYQTCSHTGGTICDRAPDESYKMAETDALGKCCVDIGLAVDVYMGEHDGDKYQVPEDAPRHTPNAANAGRQQAGTKPSNAQAAKAPATPIVEAEIQHILEAIKGLKDEADAHAYSKRMYGRLLGSVSLSPESLALIGERIIGRRCELATATMLNNLEETIKAFAAQKWISGSNSKKQLELVKRRLGIAPEAAPAGSLPLEG